MDHKKQLERAKTISDVFEIVKELVRDSIGLDQSGLIVGVSDLGSHGRGFVGAFYSLNANMIIINKRPLARILQTNPDLYKYYLFHILLHEYIHSTGSYDEAQTRQIVYEISESYFGRQHIVSELASNMEKFIHSLTEDGFQPPQDTNIEFVKGIDKKNINYIN